MSNEFKLESFVGEVTERLEKCAGRILEETASIIESQTIRNTVVGATKDTKDHWGHSVNLSENKAVVGNTQENAIWEEFGTGDYALEGKGRKSAWYVPVEGYIGNKRPTYNGKVTIVYGKNGVAYYKTNGKKPRRMLFSAYTAKKNTVIRNAQKIMKEGMK